jgi:lactate dehydrogenase-like 2-hydroxyacid dehydrogenase
MPNVIVYYTHQVPREGPDLLRPYCLVLENKNQETPTKQEVIQASKEASALCWFVPDIIDEEIISSCPNLRILAGFARGYDNVNVDAATRRGIWVTIGHEAMVEPTADLAWALVLSIARKLISADAFVRSTRRSGWHPTRLLGHQVFRKTLGIVGMGKLGRAIAKRALGFEMNILYCDKVPIEEGIERELNLRFRPLDELLKESDFVCIATPLTEHTFHQISSRELALMKPSAYLINPTRGSEVDEEAIARALRNSTIAGYAADVFEMEDKQYFSRPLQVTSGLIDQPERTILTPHIGSAVTETRVELAKYQALNVIQALRGERPVGAINDVPMWSPLL